MTRSEDYNLAELRVALNPTHPSHILPPPQATGARVLDIGCGAGQALIAAYPDRFSYGVDIDLTALRLGGTLTSQVAFSQSRAEQLPFRDAQFDLVVARVSLPYTDLRRSLREIRRVLKPTGEIWLTMHTFAIPWMQVKHSNLKGKLFFAYILLNSLAFHCGLPQFPFLWKGYESFQTNHGMRRALRASGFTAIEIQRTRHFLVTAKAG